VSIIPRFFCWIINHRSKPCSFSTTYTTVYVSRPIQFSFYIDRVSLFGPRWFWTRYHWLSQRILYIILCENISFSPSIYESLYILIVTIAERCCVRF